MDSGDVDLRAYRKFISVLVYGAIFTVLQHWGVDAAELGARFGVTMDGLSADVTDYLMLYGIPAVVGVLAQPNEIGRSIVENWKWVLGGLAALALTGAIVVMVI